MILGNGNHHVVSASKIPEDMEKYNKEFAGEDWRKLISISENFSDFQDFRLLLLRSWNLCPAVILYGVEW